MGRTMRRSSQRIREHHPTWFSADGTKSFISSMIGHPSNTIYIKELTMAIRGIFKAPLN